LRVIVDLCRPRAALEAENLALRQQIIVLRRGRPGRVPFLAVDRIVLAWLCHLCPKAREALAIVRPDTVVRLLLDCQFGSCCESTRYSLELPFNKRFRGITGIRGGRPVAFWRS
jgi:hypothetical protein